MKQIQSNAQNSEALVDLLENILVTYQDGDSRPDQSLLLYRKWRQLGAKYRVWLAKGLVVIEGGARPTSARRQRHSFAKAHLQLVPRAVPRGTLP